MEEALRFAIALWSTEIVDELTDDPDVATYVVRDLADSD